MSQATRPRRSVLYLPASNERALAKAQGLAADALIIDLEDAVAPEAKENARKLAKEAIAARGFGNREIVLRVNGLDTKWGREDLAAAAACAPDAVLIPKPMSADDIHKAESLLTEAPAATKIWAMMETPLAILNAGAIASASSRLAALVLGTNDLVKELGCSPSADRAEISASLQLCLLAARANGLACIDGVFNAIKDLEGLKSECAQGRAMGFDGKTLIHPGQLETANEAFRPSDEEVANARRIIAAYEEVKASGGGVAVLDGRIVENLHADTARKVIETSEAIASLERDLQS